MKIYMQMCFESPKIPHRKNNVKKEWCIESIRFAKEPVHVGFGVLPNTVSTLSYANEEEKIPTNIFAVIITVLTAVHSLKPKVS